MTKMNDNILKLRWIQCKCKQKANFLSANEVAFISGPCIKICRLDTYSEICIEGPAEGIQCFGVDVLSKYFAVSNWAKRTVIYIIDYTTNEIVSQLENDHFSEYHWIEFADTDHLFTLEKGPDFNLTLWNWYTAEKLHSFSHYIPTLNLSCCAFSVHPYINQMACFQQFDKIHWYRLDILGEEFQPRTQTYFLPLLEDKDCFTLLKDEKTSTLTWFEKLHHEPWGIHSELLHSLPLAACCSDMSEPELVRFYDYFHKGKRVKISCHCWYEDTYIILACMSGSVMLFNFYTGTLKYLYYSTYLKNDINAHTIRCMAMNLDGLFAGKHNGDFVIIPDVNKWEETRLFSINSSPVYMQISPDYTNLLINTETGAVLSYSTLEKALRCLAIDSDDQAILGVYVPNSLYVITAKVNGRVESWKITDGLKQSQLEMSETIKCLNGNLLIPIALISTDSSHVYLVDVSVIEEMRIIEILWPCEKPIIHICTENYCKFAVLLSDDFKVFLLSILPSDKFLLLGYFPCIFEIKDMSMISKGLGEITHVCLLCWSNPNKDTNCILSLDFPSDFVKDYHSYWKDESGILDSEAIKCKTIPMNFLCSSITLHYQFGVFLSILPDNIVQNSEDILKNIFPKGDIKRTMSNAFDLNCSRLIMSPSHNILVIINDTGKVCLWFVNNPDIQFSIDINPLLKNKEIPCITFSVNEDVLIISNQNGGIACYDIPSASGNENKIDWIMKYEDVMSEETMFLSVLETKTKEDHELIPWVTLMIDKLNEETFRNLSTKKADILQRMILLGKNVEDLANESSGIPEEYQWGNEEFVFDDELRDNLLKEREKDIENNKRSLSTQLKDGMKFINDIRSECLDSMIEKGNILYSFGKGRCLYNYPVPHFADASTLLMNRALKSSQIDECLISLVDEKEIIESEFQNELRFCEQEYDEDRDKIGLDLRKDVMVMQTREECINYTLLLEYIIFHKRLAFNKLFKRLLQLKKDTVAKIKANNEEIKDILVKIEEVRELWDPAHVVETLGSELIVTKEEIEQNCHLKREAEKILKGIATEFLEDEWLQKNLNPTVKKAQPRLRPEVITRLKKEIDKLDKASLEALNYYEKCHEQLVDEKLQWDLNINQDELQIFLILFCASNNKLLRKGDSFTACYINKLKAKSADVDHRKATLDRYIMNMNRVREGMMNEAAKIDFEVQQLGKTSGNKQALSDAYKQRPRIKSITETLNPYMPKNFVEYESFTHSNSSKLKPPRIKMPIWKEFCELREKKASIEKRIRLHDSEYAKLDRKKNAVRIWQNDLRAYILVKTVFAKYMHAKYLECNTEVPIVISVKSAQLETEFPRKITFNSLMCTKKFHVEAMNSVISIEGKKKLQLLHKKNIAENQIKRNVTRLQNISLELRDLRIDIETVLNTPRGREVLNLLQDPMKFGPHVKIQELEKSNEQEKHEIEKQVKNVFQKINRIKTSAGNLNKTMSQRKKEIVVLKGKIVELNKLGNKTRKSFNN